MRAQACFLARLARQHHEHEPLEPVDVDVVAIERDEAVDDDLALQRRKNAFLFELQQITAAAGGNAFDLVAREHAQRA